MLSAEELILLNRGAWENSWRVPWTARRSNQSILKEINTEYSLERLMWKLKLQHFGYLMRRANSLEKTPMLGKIEGRRRSRWTEDEMGGWQHWLNGHEFKWTLEVGDGQGGLVCCNSWGRKELDTTEWLNWTELKLSIPICNLYSQWISVWTKYISNAQKTFVVSFCSVW